MAKDKRKLDRAEEFETENARLRVVVAVYLSVYFCIWMLNIGILIHKWA